jgi:hypothetical protein
LGHCPSSHDGNIDFYIALLLFENFGIIASDFDNHLCFSSVGDSVAEIDESNSATINKVKVLLVGDEPRPCNPSSSDNKSFLEQGIAKFRNPFHVAHADHFRRLVSRHEVVPQLIT